jgi:glycogen operon protein
LLLNAHHEAVPFTLPAHKRGVRWELVFDTSMPVPTKRGRSFKGGGEYVLGERTCALLRLKASVERRG